MYDPNPDLSDGKRKQAAESVLQETRRHAIGDYPGCAGCQAGHFSDREGPRGLKRRLGMSEGTLLKKTGVAAARAMVARLVLLDTNVLVDWLEGAPRAQTARTFLDTLGEDVILGYSLITRFELLAVPDVARNQAALDLLGRLTPLELSTPVIDRAAQIFRTRHSRQRRKIPDALIAATAIEYGAELMTHDETDFTRIPDLQLLKPSPPSEG